MSDDLPDEYLVDCDDWYPQPDDEDDGDDDDGDDDAAMRIYNLGNENRLGAGTVADMTYIPKAIGGSAMQAMMAPTVFEYDKLETGSPEDALNGLRVTMTTLDSASFSLIIS